MALDWLRRCETRRQRTLLINFECEFESPDWFKEWDARKPDPHTEIVAEDPDRQFVPLQGKALRIRVDQDGHYGASLQFDFKKRTGSEPEEIYFRYEGSVRFELGWDNERRGFLENNRWYCIE